MAMAVTTHNGIYRASHNAQGTTYALGGIDIGNLPGLMLTTGRV
jgi:hypothetical protein